MTEKKGKRRSNATGKRPAFTDPNASREAARYAQPIASREAILHHLIAAEGPQTSAMLADALDIDSPERFEALGKRLNAMVRDGQVLQNRRGGFVPAAQLELIPGTVIANPDGFGFLRPDSGIGDDIYLPPYEMRKVMHGDHVLGSVTGQDRRGRREGSIVEVLERRLTRLIGRFAIESGISFVIPDDARIQRNVQIPADARKALAGGCAQTRHRPDSGRTRRCADAITGGGNRDPRPRPAACVPAAGAG